MNMSTAGVPKARMLPEGFVYLDEWIEDCIIDAKYAGTDNFMGRPADGYVQPLVVASVEAARALVRAADALRGQGWLIKVFDAYRPQRAVDDFCRWGADLADQRRKALHYPAVEKARMFEEGYIARRSSHTRGSAVDLTLADADGQPLDMGTRFDFMDPRSWPDSRDISPAQHENRMRLRGAMLACGFVPYEREWWHFSVDPEPYPQTYFDFPVR